MARDDQRGGKAGRHGADEASGPTISAFGRKVRMPRSRRMRIASGAALVAGGFVGFLPVLGFWMIPMGLLVLSYDIPAVRRWRRRTAVWWHRPRGDR